MAKKYHWSYEAAMQIVDEWARQFKMTQSADKYESLVQNIANSLERERGQATPRDHQPPAWRRPDKFWMTSIP